MSRQPEVRSKTSASGGDHSAWLKREGYATLAQRSRQTCTCTSMLLPLDVIGEKISMDSQLSVTEIRGEVANIWWGLGRGDGCLTLTQVVREYLEFSVLWTDRWLLYSGPCLWAWRDFLAPVALFWTLMVVVTREGAKGSLQFLMQSRGFQCSEKLWLLISQFLLN